ncbi:hypothetical protein DPEC_G00211140 [Dallia pectoralis]|uniref:Uncharacterized protein n=1 Tax=Dallia pectoralis TaxID=75939 RepID=A0ACC2G616_DALPE|nr:hypothetical protein DPEC_G00211140 [Dallia pectoralis]
MVTHEKVPLKTTLNLRHKVYLLRVAETDNHNPLATAVRGDAKALRQPEGRSSVQLSANAQHCPFAPPSPPLPPPDLWSKHRKRAGSVPGQIWAFLRSSRKGQKFRVVLISPSLSQSKGQIVVVEL